MEKETFKSIIDKFNEIVADCDHYLGAITTQDDILNLSIKEAAELKAFCAAEQSRQDKVFTEFRHLIGMGNLTPIQTQKLVKCFRDYSAYRSDIKTIASHLNTIEDIPGLPSVSQYQLHILGDITLQSVIRGEGEAVTIVEDKQSEPVEQTISVSEPTSFEGVKFEYVPSYLSGVAIKYDRTNVGSLIKAINLSKASNQQPKSLITKMFSHGACIKNSTMEASISMMNKDVYLYMDTSTKPGKKFADKLLEYLKHRKMLIAESAEDNKPEEQAEEE